MIAIVLAAGSSQRFGRCKQLEPLEGLPILAHVIRHLPDELKTFVVTGSHREVVEKWVEKEGATPLFNPNFADGIQTSVTCALQQALKQDEDLLLTLGDLPYVLQSDYLRLIKAFNEQPVFARFDNTWGPPAILPKSLLAVAIKGLGEGGLKNWVVGPVLVDIPAAAKDIDTLSDLRYP